MASASTPSANEPAQDLILIHTVQLKPMIKAQISVRMVSSGTSDAVTASVSSEKTHLKKLMMIMIIITRANKNILLKNKKRCRAAYGLKKNENKGDVELTLSKNNNK